jgi:phosphatidylglycerol:prolipoprotein diacylglycerol transferase
MLIPYIVAPEVSLSFLLRVPVLRMLLDANHPPTLKPFGLLVAVGAVAGSTLASRHAQERGLNAERMGAFLTAIMVGGFVFGHLLDAIFYHWSEVAKDPTYLLRLWDGLSSFGGFVGAAVGAVGWHLRTGAAVLPYADVVSSAFPVAWVFGRAGCAVVHDHPGRISDAWMAVAYPVPGGWQGRYDLGLYEMILTVPLAVLFLVLWRAPRRQGFYAGWMCVLYARNRTRLGALTVAPGSVSLR